MSAGAESYVAIDDSNPALRALLAVILEAQGGRIAIPAGARRLAALTDCTVEVAEQPDGGLLIIRGKHQ